MNLVVVSGRVARVVGAEAELLDLPPGDVSTLVRRPRWRSELADAAVVTTLALREARLEPPVRPGAFWLVGSNYVGRGARPERPAFYLRAAGSVSGPGDEIPAPDGLDIDPDGELAVVIGAPATHVAEADAWAHVAGVTACNDLTARVLLDGGKGAAVAKSFPGFGALGGSVLIVDGDPGPMSVRLDVDGVTRQQGTTEDMLVRVPELISRLSRFTTLMPGDVIATGAPAALAGAPAGHLAAGARTVVTVGNVLPLESRMVGA